jgi:glycosyltransferase involved in cell wall biosynthesis
MKKMLLTIAVPTYNRLNLLKKLLNHLLSDLERDSICSESVEILICDNASTDGTTHFLNTTQNPNLRVITQQENFGGDHNVRSCFEHALGTYVWIIGDDDLPMIGTVPLILKALQHQRLDLLFLRHRWQNYDLNYSDNPKVEEEGVEWKTRLSFATQVGSHITFLSSFVVNKRQYVSLYGAGRCHRHANSNVPHLAWILPMLRSGKYLFCTDAIVLTARGNNSGGYSVAETFGVWLPKILDEELGQDSDLSKIFRAFIFANFLPIWIYRAKYSLAKGFSSKIPWSELDQVNLNHLEFRLFVRSLRGLNKPVSLIVVFLGRLYFKVKMRQIRNKK